MRWLRTSGVVMLAALLTATSGGALDGMKSRFAAASVHEPTVEPPAPLVWEAPSAVNTTPLGELPRGAWTYAGSSNEPNPASLQATDASLMSTPADDAIAQPGLGAQDFYSFEEFPLGERLSAAVNVANGNLLVRDTSLAINGPQIGLTLDQFYNGLSARSGAYGPKWSMTAGQDIGLEITSTQVIFRGPSGFRAKFGVAGTIYTPPAGLNARLVKNGNGTYTLTFNGSDERMQFTSGGYLTRHEERNNNAIVYGYNANNTLASITDTAGRVTSFTYVPGTTLVSLITDPAEREVSFEYTSGRLTGVTNAGGQTSLYAYDASGRMTAVRTPGGSYAAITYDTASRVASIRRYQGRTTTINPPTGTSFLTQFSYATGSTTQINPRNFNTVYTIDNSGRVTKNKDPLNRERSQSWSPNSSVATATDAMGSGTTAGNITNYTYDALNNPTSVQSPTGASAQATYATGGSCGSTDATHPYQAKCTQDDAGNISRHTYDGPGNQLTSTDSASNTTITREYQGTNGITCGGKAGQVCSSTNGKGDKTTYAYDASGNLVTADPPGPLGTTTMSYDSIGRVATVTDGRGNVTEYDYDVMDRIVRTDDETVASVVTTSYDFDGNVTRSFDTVAGAGEINYTYDGMNRQISARPSAVGNPDLLLTYDATGNVATAVNPNGTTTYTYDAANQLTALAEPGGTCPASGPGTKCTRFEYDMNGAMTKTTFPGGTTETTTRDNAGRATRIQALAPNTTVLSDFSYTYNFNAQAGATADRMLLQTRTDHLGVAVPAGAIATHGYDSMNRLTSVTERLGSTVIATYAYQYDKSGNRTQETRSGATGFAAGTSNAVYNASDELVSRDGASFSYDANGNETTNPGNSVFAMPSRTSSSNPRNQIARITTTPLSGAAQEYRFEYHGSSNDQRMATWPVGFDRTRFTGAPTGLTRTVTGGTTTSYIRTPDGRPIAQVSGGVSRYYLLDALGSVVGMVDSAGVKVATFAYDPYGNSRLVAGTASGNNPLRYTGGYLDIATGLYKLGLRYYDPSIGRFTQMDPTGQDAHYLYGGGNPVNAVDTSGDAFFLPLIAGVVGRAAISRIGMAIGARAIGSRALGASSRLFGNNTFGTRAGLLNAAGRGGARLGWSAKGYKGEGAYTMFRAKTRGGTYIDLFRGPRLPLD